MGCQTPYGTRWCRGKISLTAKHTGGRNYTGGAVTVENKELTQKANLLSIMVALADQQLNRIPFWKKLYRQGKRG